MNTEAEEWRQIPDFPEYSVSNFGRIRRVTVTDLKGSAGPFGHTKVELRSNGKVYHALVHRLVAAAFLPTPAAERKEVAHNDGNARNNHVSNLRWATRRENAQDTIIHGTVARGSRNGTARFTEDQIRHIRQLRAMGVKNKTLAAEYGVDKCTISAICVGRNWKHVA